MRASLQPADKTRSGSEEETTKDDETVSRKVAKKNAEEILREATLSALKYRAQKVIREHKYKRGK